MFYRFKLSLIVLAAAMCTTSSFQRVPVATRDGIKMPAKRLTTQKTDTLSFPKISTERKVCMRPIKQRGGLTLAAPLDASALLNSVANLTASLWAAIGFVAILGKSIKRILPLALEPFGADSPALSTFQFGSYIVMCLWFSYVEGYKGFQLKFSPLVVARAQTLKPFQGTPIHHVLFGPFYAMGLFHATKKRKIVSWSVSLGVATIVAIVKKLPYPWRNIIDAGVIAGLSWGSISILTIWIKTAILGIDSGYDPALP